MSDYMPPNAYRLYARTAEALARCIGGAPKGLDTEQFELVITISRETRINTTDSRALHTYIRLKLDAHTRYIAAVRRIEYLVQEYGASASMYEIMMRLYDDPLCKEALDIKGGELIVILSGVFGRYVRRHHQEILTFLASPGETPTDF